MNVESILIIIFGALILLEGFVLTFSYENVKKILVKMSKNRNLLVSIGLIEILLGFVFIYVGFM